MRPIRNVKKHLIQCFIRCSKNRITTKTQDFLTQIKQSTSFVSVPPAWPTDETMFLFCFRHKRESKQYAVLTGKQEIRNYRLGHLIHLPSWVSEIILLNKSQLSQEVNIMSAHQQFQQLGHPFRCQSIKRANYMRNAGLSTWKKAARNLVIGINQVYLLRYLRQIS